MTDREFLFGVMKAQAWEEAKGKLRALVAMQGAIPSDYDTPTEEQTWKRLDVTVETFIAEVEDNGLHD